MYNEIFPTVFCVDVPEVRAILIMTNKRKTR